MTKHQVLSLIICEKLPNIYIASALTVVSVSEDKGYLKCEQEEINEKDFDFNILTELRKIEGQEKIIQRSSSVFNVLLRNVFFFMEQKNIIFGSTKDNSRFKVKTDKGNEIVKIKKIIYCTNKKYKEINTHLNSYPIDYSHRFLVRGHWRRIKTLGKDRAGSYCVKGYTWVAEHERGDESLPLVSDKVRVFV